MEKDNTVFHSEDEQSVAQSAVELFEQLDIDVQENILALLREIVRK